MKQKVVILVGTMGGNAELAAETIADVMRRGGFNPEVFRMEQITAMVFEMRALFVICVSSCGHGALPHNARPLFAELTENRPDLSKVHFGVFALGDLVGHAETFCFAGSKFESLLVELGAHLVAPTSRHDHQGGRQLESQAEEWASGLAQTVRVG